MLQNFGLPQSASIEKFFGKIHFWNCYDQEVDKEVILQKFWFAWFHARQESFRIKCRFEISMTRKPIMIWYFKNLVSGLNRLLSGSYFEIITNKEADDKKFFVEFDPLKCRNILFTHLKLSQAKSCWKSGFQNRSKPKFLRYESLSTSL